MTPEVRVSMQPQSDLKLFANICFYCCLLLSTGPVVHRQYIQLHPGAVACLPGHPWCSEQHAVHREPGPTGVQEPP